MSVSLIQILSLVGKLDDAQEENTARERFRIYLKDNVKEVGLLRDYIEECLRKSGDQYSRALQDLVNHLATFLEFDVTYGRYKGVTGQIGFDGLWKSPNNFYIVSEVKTTETYTIKTTTLLNYIDSLISDKKISDRDHVLGLYIIGRPDNELRQLESSIIAEKRLQHLRIISIESLLSLAELKTKYDINHDDILAIMKPSGPNIDSVVDLMARLVAQEKAEEEVEVREVIPPKNGEINYWLAPVGHDEKQTAEEVIQNLIGQENIYAFGDRTPGRKHIKPGDLICFYAKGTGIVAHAEVASIPEHKSHSKIKHPTKYPWVFSIKKANLYIETPVIVDSPLREKLNAFQGKDLTQGWGWFVQATRKLTENDFRLLTRR